MRELFLDILEKKQAEETLPFLQQYTYDERRELVPEIKKKIKELQEYEYSGGRGEIKGTPNHFVILSIAAFACFTLDEYKRNRISLSYLSDGFIKFHEYSQQDLMKKIITDDILEWYCPGWLGEYLNDSKANEEFKTADYITLMRWKEKGYIYLSGELVANTLQQCIFTFNRDKGNHGSYEFTPQNLLKYPQTLTEHIWFLFQYPTIIYNHYYYGTDKETNNWISAFIKLTEENKIDRLEVLKACLSAFNHNFNKPLTSWFVELFNSLAPTDTELLKIQDDLFSSLHSVQSKAVTNSLKLLKSLVGNPLFKAEDFISCIPVLLTSSIKAIVSNTLVIIEKIIKEKPELSGILSVYIVDVFSQKEEALQKKASQLINKFGNPDSEELKNKVAVYQEQILLSIQPELKIFLPESEAVTKELSLPDNIKLDILSPIREDNKVKEITDWEDFIFFLGSAYTPDQTLPFDLIPALFIKFNSTITAENVNQLLPLIQKSYKIQQEWTSGLRLFDRLLSAFITSYADYLEEKFPEITEDIQSLKKEFAKKYQRERPLSLDNWSTRVTSSLTYEPYHQILEYSLNKIKKQETLPLLSTPTHEPCWINPLILTERLVLYQKNNENPDTMDVQLALQRCVLDNPADAISFVTDNLTGEYKELLLFLLNPVQTYSSRSVEHHAWWFIACFISGKEIPEELQEAFPNFPQEYITGDYKWKILKDTLSFEYPYYTLSGNDRELFMNYIISAKIGGGIFGTDLPHLLFSMPNRHDWIWVYVLKHYMKHPENDATQNNVLCTLISDLQMLNSGLTNITYLFFACTLVNANKTVRSVAGEYWIDFVYKDRIENFRLGEILGKLESKEWAPVKRFTDLISENLWNISNNHDQGLQIILESFISELTHPVKNSKKVLELYYELLIRNQALPEAKVIPKLQSWESENSLKKICKQIVNKTMA